MASEIDCKAMWSKDDPNDSGHISGDRTVIYVEAMMTSGRVTAAADRIVPQEFMAACMDSVREGQHLGYGHKWGCVRLAVLVLLASRPDQGGAS